MSTYLLDRRGKVQNQINLLRTMYEDPQNAQDRDKWKDKLLCAQDNMFLLQEVESEFLQKVDILEMEVAAYRAILRRNGCSAADALEAMRLKEELGKMVTLVEARDKEIAALKEAVSDDDVVVRTLADGSVETISKTRVKVGDIVTVRADLEDLSKKHVTGGAWVGEVAEIKVVDGHPMAYLYWMEPIHWTVETLKLEGFVDFATGEAVEADPEAFLMTDWVNVDDTDQAKPEPVPLESISMNVTEEVKSSYRLVGTGLVITSQPGSWGLEMRLAAKPSVEGLMESTIHFLNHSGPLYHKYCGKRSRLHNEGLVLPPLTVGNLAEEQPCWGCVAPCRGITFETRTTAANVYLCPDCATTYTLVHEIGVCEADLRRGGIPLDPTKVARLERKLEVLHMSGDDEDTATAPIKIKLEKRKRRRR